MSGYIIGITWSRNSLSLAGTEGNFGSPQSLFGLMQSGIGSAPCLLPEANVNSLWRKHISRSLKLSQSNKSGEEDWENFDFQNGGVRTSKNLFLLKSDKKSGKTCHILHLLRAVALNSSQKHLRAPHNDHYLRHILYPAGRDGTPSLKGHIFKLGPSQTLNRSSFYQIL